MQKIREISGLLHDMKQAEIYQLFLELFTDTELETLSKRWRILEMLNEKRTQRQIANELNVSLCKVTRGAKILKQSNSIVRKFMKKGVSNEEKKIN